MSDTIENVTPDNSTNDPHPGRPTGPRTPEGKSVTSLNATRHGCTARTVVIPGEDPEEYRLQRESLFARYNPVGPVESGLVQTLCDAMWRLNRIPGLEGKATAAGDFKTVDTLSKHEARLNRLYMSTLDQLACLVEIRIRERSLDLDAAMFIRMADKAANRSTDLKPLGFVLTLEEVDAAVRRQNAFHKAEKALGYKPGTHPRGPSLTETRLC